MVNSEVKQSIAATKMNKITKTEKVVDQAETSAARR